MKQDYQKLYKTLCYTFTNKEYLFTALTHRSVGMPNNERLEFLGDSLLGYIVAEALFQRFPTATEGELTRLRASLVKGETLAEIAQDLNVGQYLRLGGGELKSGGWRRASTLADALEAIIGAVYLDSSMEECRRVVLLLLDKRLKAVSPKKMVKDPKTRLQEYLQSKQQTLPTYEVLSIDGEAHAQNFEVECVIPVLPRPTYGRGESRRRAEQAAAAKALSILKNA